MFLPWLGAGSRERAWSIGRPRRPGVQTGRRKGYLYIAISAQASHGGRPGLENQHLRPEPCVIREGTGSLYSSYGLRGTQAPRGAQNLSQKGIHRGCSGPRGCEFPIFSWPRPDPHSPLCRGLQAIVPALCGTCVGVAGGMSHYTGTCPRTAAPAVGPPMPNSAPFSAASRYGGRARIADGRAEYHHIAIRPAGNGRCISGTPLSHWRSASRVRAALSGVSPGWGG
jgi:hypothetical protein